MSFGQICGEGFLCSVDTKSNPLSSKRVFHGIIEKWVHFFHLLFKKKVATLNINFREIYFKNHLRWPLVKKGPHGFYEIEPIFQSGKNFFFFAIFQ